MLTRILFIGALGRGGKVVVPAIVDRMQELALAALQALKVSFLACLPLGTHCNICVPCFFKTE